MEPDESYMKIAVALASKSVKDGGGPFATVIVDKNGDVLSIGNNQVVKNCDPSAHGEVVAIRKACELLKAFSLEGCTLYTNCEPCVMCWAACCWARIKRIVYANTREDAGAIGFDDDLMFQEIGKPINERTMQMDQCGRKEALVTFKEWEEKEDKVTY